LKEALYYKRPENLDQKVRCLLCPHLCYIPEGGTGLCQVRHNSEGVLYAQSYGQITSMALDPIEKKPLIRFFPGTRILSVGSYGCNFRCSFCQNHSISFGNPDTLETHLISPIKLVEKAIDLMPEGNMGLAFTYNEPLIGYEYVFDCAKLAKDHNLKTVLVTNGYISEKPLFALLPYIDAMNIDLKSFSPLFYRKIGGQLSSVKNTIEISAKLCHVEITTLIIPGENDSLEEMTELSRWISTISPDIPLHISRFFPRYKLMTKEPTPTDTILNLCECARSHLNYVYEGNI